MCFSYLHLPLMYTPNTTMCSSDKLTRTHSLFRLYIFTVLLLQQPKKKKKEKIDPLTNYMQINCNKLSFVTGIIQVISIYH